ncbi:MAG: hypothetical protein ACM3QZ_02030 [Solirubrobacterales bacterium]
MARQIESESRRRFPASVTRVHGNRLVIDRGLNDGIRIGQRFIVYNVSPIELVDPITNKSHGPMEVLKGRGRAIQVGPDSAVLRIEYPPVESGQIVYKNRPLVKTTRVNRKALHCPKAVGRNCPVIPETISIGHRGTLLLLHPGDKVKPL